MEIVRYPISLIKYKGRFLVSLYIMPMYSPITPNANRITPLTNSSVDISDGYPATSSP